MFPYAKGVVTSSMPSVSFSLEQRERCPLYQRCTFENEPEKPWLSCGNMTFIYYSLCDGSPQLCNSFGGRKNIKIRNRCFTSNGRRVTFREAENDCRSIGLHMASLINQDDAFLKQLADESRLRLGPNKFWCGSPADEAAGIPKIQSGMVMIISFLLTIFHLL